jgi:hypothetical protein
MVIVIKAEIGYRFHAAAMLLEKHQLKLCVYPRSLATQHLRVMYLSGGFLIVVMIVAVGI